MKLQLGSLMICMDLVTAAPFVQAFVQRPALSYLYCAQKSVAQHVEETKIQGIQ